jgi:hypothetical protein
LPAGLLPGGVDWKSVDVAALAVPSDQPVGLVTLLRIGWRLRHDSGAAIKAQLDEFVSRGGRVAVCADDASLAVAVAYRYLLNRPLAPVRLVTEALGRQPGRFGIWFRNRACLAHIAADRAQAEAARAHTVTHGYRLLSIVQPLTVDPHAVQDLLRKTIEAVGAPPSGDEHLRLAYVSHFYCNQENTNSVFELLRRYQNYEPALLDRVHFVIVDDGSPFRYQVPEFDLNLTWLKIDKDIHWNQGGARNLGVVYARAEKLFLCDIDVEVPEHTLGYFLRRRTLGKRMDRPCLHAQSNGAYLGRHPNAFLMSRGSLLKHFGYDEEFSGHYGFEDLRFTKHQKLWGTFLGRLRREYFVYDRSDVDRGKSYHSLYRDESDNALLNARKHFEVDWYGRHGGHSRRNLAFTWKVLADYRRARPAPSVDRLFKPTWYLRQIWPG